MLGRIYMIYYINDKSICYIGSTFKNILNRYKDHELYYNEWKNGFVKGKCAIYPYFKEYGFDKFKMKLIKEYNVIDKRHLYVYETLWIKKSKSVNIRQPFGLCGTKIYKEMYKNKKRNHYRENKEL